MIRGRVVGGRGIHHRGTETTEQTQGREDSEEWISVLLGFGLLCALCVSVVNLFFLLLRLPGELPALLGRLQAAVAGQFVVDAVHLVNGVEEPDSERGPEHV